MGMDKLIKSFETEKNSCNFNKIIENLMNYENIWFLMSKVTLTYYIEYHELIPSISIFVDKECAEKHQINLLKKGIETKVRKTSKDKVRVFIQEFIRYGVERLVVCEGETSFLINLPTLTKENKTKDVSRKTTNLLNQTLMCKVNTFLQDTNNGIKENEEDVFFEISQANYFMAVDTDGLSSDEIEEVRKGKKLASFITLINKKREGHFAVFTDMIEFLLWKEKYPNDVIPLIVDFYFILEMVVESKKNKHITINPYGFNFKIDEVTLKRIKKITKDIKDTNKNLAIKKLTLFIYHIENMLKLAKDYEDINEELTNKLRDYISENKEIEENFTPEEVEDLFYEVFAGN